MWRTYFNYLCSFKKFYLDDRVLSLYILPGFEAMNLNNYVIFKYLDCRVCAIFKL